MQELKVFENKEIGLSARVMPNDDGSISINAEDTAIGFGWTQVKNGKMYVKWERINGYCKELGFSPLVGKDDYIPESLFYRLGMKASNPAAEKFQNWLAMEVIPSIRKNGGYIAGQNSMTPEQIVANALVVANNIIAERDKTIAMQNEKLEAQKPFVDFAVHVSQSKDIIDMEEMSKIAQNENIDIGRNRLIGWLKDNHVLQKNRIPYQTYIDRGYFDVVEVKKDTMYGTKVFTKTVVTGKGQLWIIDKLRKQYH